MSDLVNLEAEAALLGALLTENGVIAHVAGMVSAADFGEPLHQRIYAKICERHANGEPVNPALLVPCFANDPDIQSLGGHRYLAELTLNPAALLAIDSYAGQVRELAERRKTAQALSDLAGACRDMSSPPAELAARLAQLAASTGAAGPSSSLPIIDMAAWDGQPPQRQSLWGDMLPLLQTTMLTGQGGVGKSLLVQMLCTAIALGKPLLGAETTRRNALYVTCEDDTDELWRRQDAICAALGVASRDLAGKLFLVSLAGLNNTALATFDDAGVLRPTDRWRQIEQTCRAHSVGFYAFDGATDAMAGDLNDLHQVAEFVNLLTGLAIRCNGAAMLLHHPNRKEGEWLGSVAWHNKVRSRLFLDFADSEADPDARVIHAPKANYGPSGGRIAFRWHRGAFVRDEDLPADYAAELAQSVKASGENEAFLACLRERAEQGEGRGVGPSPGPNYAPAQFEGMAQARGLKKAALRRAMDRLFSIGRIEAHTYRNKAKGRDVTIIREAPELPRTPTPNASRTLFPNSPEQSARTTPRTHCNSTSISGPALEVAGPGAEEGAGR